MFEGLFKRTTLSDRQERAVRKTLQGIRRDVLHLSVPPPVHRTGPIGPNDEEGQEKPVPWAGSWAETGPTASLD